MDFVQIVVIPIGWVVCIALAVIGWKLKDEL
jgi:hypothetical protein